MKVFIAGANGRVGKALIPELLKRGHAVTAGVRTPETFEIADDISVVPFNLTASEETIESAIAGSDAIYFVAGSRGKNLLQVDAFGAVKLQRAAQKAGVKRFIQLSALFATTPDKWTDPRVESIKDYHIAKFFADEWLINNTNLEFTILQPGALVEAETGTGLIRTNVFDFASNTIPNVAETLAEILETPNTIGRVISMADGDDPIKEVLADF